MLEGKAIIPCAEVLPPHSLAGNEKNHIKTSEDLLIDAVKLSC
jgi:hypothetical protein